MMKEAMVAHLDADDENLACLDTGDAAVTSAARTRRSDVVIGRVVPRTTMRPAREWQDIESDEVLGRLMRHTDERTEGDAPSIERVRTSSLDAVGKRPPSLRAPRDPAVRAREIVDELGSCGPGDELAHLGSLRALGALGLTALVRNFPGLLWFDHRLPHRRAPRGRDASPICSLLVRLGRPAAPYVHGLLESPDPITRYYAALVTADLNAPELLEPLSALLFDEVAEVREAALRAVSTEADAPHTAARTDALALVAARVRERVASRDCTAFERVAAVFAMGALRDVEALSLLPPLLEWVDREVSFAAEQALRQITGTSLGRDARAWRRWVARHGTKPRSTWLVRSLASRDVELRSYAHQELVRLLGDDFGYDPEMGPLARFIAQRRARRLIRSRSRMG